jgi:hypothetical protein
VSGEILAIQTYDASHDDGIEQSFCPFAWLSLRSSPKDEIHLPFF